MISAREQPSVGAPSASPSAATSRQPRIRSYNGTRPMQLVPFSIASLMPHWPTIAAFPAGCSGERGDDPSGGLLGRDMLPDAKDRPACGAQRLIDSLIAGDVALQLRPPGNGC